MRRLDNEIKSAVRGHILEKIVLGDWPDKDLRDDTPLFHSGLMDSVSKIGLIEFLEKTFDIRIAFDEVSPANFADINSIAAFVSTKIARGR